MDKQNNKSTNESLSFSTTDNSSLLLGGVIVLLIASSPFIFYFYKSFPSKPTWEVLFLTISTKADTFGTVDYYAYYFLGKAVPLFLLLIWFFTCKHWWHWIILVPIAMYSFQLWGVINQNQNLDEIELIYIVPLMAIIVPLVYLVRAKLFNKVRGTDLKAFEEELMTKKSVWGQIKDLFR